ncbi:hypothetical protein [Nonomuraea bangladeshensis]|uniref:hypothetical protein n=1 Tax=Nonomuraea bangladeshensis TaxID=404385 RepID=UPI003C2B672F
MTRPPCTLIAGWLAAAAAGVMMFLLLDATPASAACGTITYEADPSHPFELPELGCDPAIPAVGTGIASTLALVATTLHALRLYRAGAAEEWLTGARRRPRDILDDLAQTKWAKEAYDSFLADSRDITAISANTRDVLRMNGSSGFTEKEISDVKRHLMETAHRIEDRETGEIVLRSFDADPEIADAWIRLRSGRPLPEDFILLEHELAELNYLREHPGCTYQEAHAAANETYHWESQVPLNIREDMESDW